MSYARFLAMIATSTVTMFGLMYLNTYALEHVLFSETRTYMALYMGATMAVIMLLFMWGMYRRTVVNAVIIAGSVAVFALSLYLLRSQTTVQDVSWMRAMIPHHSIAILTSERADLSDPRVRELASEIIATQREEIAMMKRLIADLDG
jgi:ABC-type multidrug transport system fused ATPase/permease subunit